MPEWVKLYHRLPYPLRVIAASVRGLQLRLWRYGKETEQLITEALERETWSVDQWKTWQESRLAFVLHRAATRVTYYRKQWEARRRQGDCASWDYLENWPVLEKETLRQNNPAFVADDCDLRLMFPDHTSGTSGKPLTIWQSRASVHGWYALCEARWRRWYGVSRNDRWAILGGQLVAPIAVRLPPFWVWNAGLNQLYMSSYHLSPDLIPYFLDALVQHRIVYLWGYSSSLYTLAQEAIRLDRRVPMKVVITNAEPLYDYQRRAMEITFQCPVYETYGMSEAVVAASQCSTGNLHLWPEVGILEVQDEYGVVSKGVSGDLISTGLFNADMPLIRYRTGDRASLSAEAGLCPCGRSLPLLASVEGRVDDILYTRDGRSIGRLDPVFKADLPIRAAQIIQETLDLIRVKIVPAPEYTEEAGKSIVERLQARMGSVNVILEAVEDIPRTVNGKFRAVVCNLPPGQRVSHDK